MIYISIYDQLILRKVPQQFNEARIVLPANGAGTTASMHEKMSWNPYLIFSTDIYSKQGTDKQKLKLYKV